ncbi:Gfo/Idh/MocA family protein [Leptospira brenneri]|uniref:Gfo/Idh/MocA family oxidoreductase n=1 Tax=Leptospira brenneri TaxID=2023182 RepID=A0A2M9Y1S2_9LEPT|nr:Gfo/Idh/MocA family oxidoreductase [Leptospira brenneri]PJZ45520.1 hypothetical protein CH361_10880 [Leptospira brenneri]TGK92013.1 gfo/Idh/MocA family oxidoreductase [Leptospira brenneri]
MINRLLIVGLGSIGKRHLRLARELFPDAEIKVLRHKPGAETPEFADGCLADMEQVATFAPQIAVIANPAPFHISTALALVALDCHLLIEKPLSDTTEGVSSLIEKAHTRKLVLQVGYNLRFLPSLEKFRDCIHAGTIGRILSIRCEIGQYLPSWRPQTDYRQNVSAQKDLGGGVLLELSHELDYLRWIFGDVSWVQAWLNRQSSLEIDVEDTAHLTLGFKPQVSGQVPPVASVSLDFIRHDRVRLCTVIGESGSLRWNGLTGEVEEYRVGDEAWKKLFHYVQQGDDSYRAQWKHFLSCVEYGLNPLVNGEDGLAVLEIIEAVRKSSKEKSRVVIL